MNKFYFVVFILLTIFMSRVFADEPAAPLLEAKTNTIGYPDVVTALKALQARSDAKSYTQPGGWIIVEIPSEYTMWTFVPKGNPAYPAVVKRVITRQGDELYIAMNVLCEASKEACDDLVRQFNKLNNEIRKSITKKQ